MISGKSPGNFWHINLPGRFTWGNFYHVMNVKDLSSLIHTDVMWENETTSKIIT